MKEAHTQKALLASSVTVGTVIILVIAKSIAYYKSDSAAVLSSLVDSLSDIGMSLMTWFSIRWSLKPADENHRHGHGKIEGVAALLQSAILMGAGAFLLLTAIDRFIHPAEIMSEPEILVLMILSAVASLALTFVQRHANKESHSLALEADQKHYGTDVWMNGIVLIVVGLSYYNMAPFWLDPACTILIAALFAQASFGIAKDSFAMLMDREVAQDIRERILSLIMVSPDVRGIHDLRCIRSGMKMLISMDMEVEGTLNLSEAHEIAQEAEYRILKEFPNAEILIHIDPEGDIDDSRHGVITT